MPRLSISIDDNQDDWLDSEADRQERSKAQIVRKCIDLVKNGAVDPETETTSLVQTDAVQRGDYDDLEERVERLEQRLDELEQPAIATDAETSIDGDLEAVVEWVAESQPVSKADIVDAHYPPDCGLKEKTWWETRAREALKEEGFEYVRNVGWTG